MGNEAHFTRSEVMTTQAHVAVTAARKAVYDKVESQIHTFEAQVATLKAKAESAKADAEIKAIANLATAKRTLDEKVAELKGKARPRSNGENRRRSPRCGVRRVARAIASGSTRDNAHQREPCMRSITQPADRPTRAQRALTWAIFLAAASVVAGVVWRYCVRSPPSSPGPPCSRSSATRCSSDWCDGLGESPSALF
jgi:hypothetical protein